MACLFLFSSCASIFSKTRYPVNINSSPSNSKVVITDITGKQVYVGTTPALVRLKSGAGFFKRAEYQVRISNPGYEDRIILITSEIDGWYFGNILLGGVFGMLIVDPLTGAMWKLDTRYIDESLTRSISSNGQELKILNIEDISDEMKAHLVKVKPAEE